MNVPMTKELIRRLLIFIFCIGSSFLYAQPGDPNEDPQVPISGIWLLLAGGAAFGAKKIYDMTRRKK
jgi:hypothetical protein